MHMISKILDPWREHYHQQFENVQPQMARKLPHNPNVHKDTHTPKQEQSRNDGSVYKKQRECFEPVRYVRISD